MLTMEPPVGGDSEAIRDEKVKVLKAIPELEHDKVVRGQFVGYRNEQGVDPDSQVETFVALQLEINSWRWQGVPVFIRAGKCMPVTCTEVTVKLRRPPAIYNAAPPPPNYLRFQLSPDVTIALGTMVKIPGEQMIGKPVELLLSHHTDGEQDAYERLLSDAIKGDSALFAREDSVEAAWRIVEAAATKPSPVYPYEPNTWGPLEVEQVVAPPGGWRNPQPVPEKSGKPA
jgi:glucose-6-phosphate 1-dehydrogenase